MSHQELMKREELWNLQSLLNRELYRREEISARIAAAEQKIVAIGRENTGIRNPHP